MFEIVFANNLGEVGKIIHVVADDFDEALSKCRRAGYDTATYNEFGTADIISFKKINNIPGEIIH